MRDSEAITSELIAMRTNQLGREGDRFHQSLYDKKPTLDAFNLNPDWKHESRLAHARSAKKRRCARYLCVWWLFV